MHEGWSLQEIKELREWSTEGDEKQGCIRFESLNPRNSLNVIPRATCSHFKTKNYLHVEKLRSPKMEAELFPNMTNKTSQFVTCYRQSLDRNVTNAKTLPIPKEIWRLVWPIHQRERK